MDVTAVKYWASQGVLGLFCLVLIFAVIHLWKEVRRLHAEKDAQAEKHRTELAAIVDKYVTAAQTQIEKYHALAEKSATALKEVLAALRRERKRGT